MPLNANDIRRAAIWYREHHYDVERMMFDISAAGNYMPTGKTIMYPERWIAAHWRWFFDQN